MARSAASRWWIGLDRASVAVACLLARAWPGSNADKRRAVLTLLNDEEWATWSARDIAKACCVSHDFVARIKSSLSSDDSEAPAAVTFTTKHGTTATMNTAGIGKARQPAVADQAAPPRPENPPAQRARPAASASAAAPEAFDPDRPAILGDYDLSKDVLSDAEKLVCMNKMNDEILAENDILRAQVDAFAQADQGAEMEKQIRMRFAFEQQAMGYMAQVAQLDKELRYLGKLFGELRKITGGKSNADVVAAVRAAVKATAARTAALAPEPEGREGPSPACVAFKVAR